MNSFPWFEGERAGVFYSLAPFVSTTAMRASEIGAK
jgi:hypothetical protein